MYPLNFKRTFYSLSLIAVLLLSATCDKHLTDPDTETVYFKVGEITPGNGESFIIGLTDPADITYARKLIEDPDSTPDKILSARIVPQTGDEEVLNRDVNNNKIWSWRIDEFDGFVFNTIEILDGWPGYVEEDLKRWFQNTTGSDEFGYIGFWNYTIVEEIEPVSETFVRNNF